VLAHDDGGALARRISGRAGDTQPSRGAAASDRRRRCDDLRSRHRQGLRCGSASTESHQESVMNIADIRRNAFAMPLHNPAFPRPPYKFYNREFMIITYRSDPAVVRELVPEPLEPIGDTVAYAFIRMPD